LPIIIDSFVGFGKDKGKENEDSKNSSTSAHNMCVDVWPWYTDANKAIILPSETVNMVHR